MRDVTWFDRAQAFENNEEVAMPGSEDDPERRVSYNQVAPSSPIHEVASPIVYSF